MRHLLLLATLFALTLSPLILSAQAFERYYDSGAEDVGRGLTLIDGRAVVVGHRQEGEGPRQGAILITDRAGNQVSQRQIVSNRRNQLFDVAPAGPDEFLTAGWNNVDATADDWMLHRFTAGGEERAANGIGVPERDEQIYRLENLGDGTFVGVGNEGSNNHAIIARFDRDGNDLWRRRFYLPGARFTVFSDLAIAPDGVVAAGWTTENETLYRAVVVKYSLAGELLWRRVIDHDNMAFGGLRSIARLPSGRLIVLSPLRRSATDIDIGILQLNGDGNLERTACFGTDQLDFGRVIRPSRNGREGFIIGGSTRTAEGPSSAFAVSIDELVSARAEFTLFAPEFNSSIQDIVVDETGDYWFAGSARPCPDGDRDFLLIRTGPDLRTPAGDCDDYELTFDGGRFEAFQATAGISLDWNAPTLSAPASAELPMTDQTRSCPAFDLDADAAGLDYDGGDLCYDGPLPVTAADVAASLPQTTFDSIQILGLIDSGETVTLDHPLARRRGDRSVTLVNDGSLSAGDAAGLLAAVRFTAARPAGERRFVITVRVGCNWRRSVTAGFTILPALDDLPSLPDTSLCPGAELLLDVSAPGVETYDWGDGARDAVRGIKEPGEYVVVRANACSSVADTFIVTSAEPRLTYPVLRPHALCPGDSLSLDVTTVGATGYRWGDGSRLVTRTFRQPGTYQLTITDACADTTLAFRLDADDCCPIYLPNAFSPNGDGINDVFRAFPHPEDCAPVSDYRFRVFDRWGGLVYAGDSLTGGWDGQTKGAAAGPGHYVYVVTYFDGFLGRERKGGVVLIR